MKAFFELPVVTKQSLPALRRIDSALKHMQALNVFNRPVTTWDDPIISLIAEKLDEITRKKWEGSLTRDDPKFLHLFAFLERKCEILCEDLPADTSCRIHTPYKRMLWRNTVNEEVKTIN